MNGEFPLPGFLTDGEMQDEAGREADVRAAQISEAAEARNRRELAEAARQRAAGVEEEPRTDAYAELGFSHPSDGSLGGAMQALEDSAAAQAAEQPRGPYPWDMSDADKAANQTGIPKVRQVLREAGATAEQRREAALRKERDRIAAERKRDADLGEAAKLVGGRFAAEEAAEEEAGRMSDGPAPIKGAINTPEEARDVADELRHRKDAG
jgi:hypothetical protein